MNPTSSLDRESYIATRPMRKLLAACLTIALLGCCVAVLGQSPQNAPTIRLRLRDAETGNAIAGMIRVFVQDDDKPLPLDGLLSRLTGLNGSKTSAGWHLLPADGASMALPARKLRFEALYGLETNLLRQEVDLTRDQPD